MPANWRVSCCDDFWALIGYRAAYVTLGHINTTNSYPNPRDVERLGRQSAPLTSGKTNG